MPGGADNDDIQHDSRVDPLRFASEFHAPVLCKTVVEGLVTNLGGRYVDATLGGGGHTAALLDQLEPRGFVLGIDHDAEALETVQSRLATDQARGRLKLRRGNFADLEMILADVNVTEIDGLLIDLGVSSHQLDAPRRGFSYMTEGPLDMRMNPMTGLSAAEVVNNFNVDELRHVLRAFGEEPRAGRIASALVVARPLKTTIDLARVIRNLVPGREVMKTLSRVFQAIRITVNGELEALENVLNAAVRVIRPGGRIAVISYHSLEDRRVKRFLRYGNMEGSPTKDLYGNLLTPWLLINRRPLMADEYEIAVNSRARSARLRIAERRPTLEPES